LKIQLLNLKGLKEKILNKRKKRGRRIVSDNLPVKEKIIPLEEENRVDELGNPLVFLGYADKRQLHIIPAQIYCMLTRREIWGYSDSRDIVKIAGMPDCIIPKGKYTDETICHFIYEKFYNGTPYHRQIASLNAAGGDFSKSTISDATGCFAEILKPVTLAIKDQVFQSNYIHADETHLKHGNFKKKMERKFITVFQDCVTSLF
jgi:transposase